MAGRTTDFNGRVSQQYRNPGANGRTASTSTKRKEEDSNAFMRLVRVYVCVCVCVCVCSDLVRRSRSDEWRFRAGRG